MNLQHYVDCYMGLVARKSVFGVSEKRDSNQSHQLQGLDSKFKYDTFQKTNNKGADQTARMPRLVCACVIRKPPTSRPI